MIYIYDRENKFARWVSGYVSNLARGLREVGADVEVVNSFDSIPSIPSERDAVIVVDYMDLDRMIEWRKINDFKFKIVSHSHGTSAFLLGCKDKGDIDREKKQLQSIDLVCCNTEYHRDVMLREGYGNAVVTGYPIDFDYIRNFASPMDTRREGIVVGGRIEQDRQLFLAVEALEPFGDAVIFCTPNDKEWACRLWGRDTIERFEQKFTFHWECQQEDFYKILSEASVVTTFGCVDTLNLSLIEGAVLGCYPLAPKKLPYLEFINDGYEPYSLVDIRERIINQPPVETSYLKYDYRLVAMRYKKEIEKLIGGN